MNTFGERLREARKAKNLTQKELAELIGAKHNSISNWENDQNKPDPDTIELICGILNIEPNYLLQKSNTSITSPDISYEPIYVNNMEKQIIYNYRKADDIDQKIILRTLNLDDNIEVKISDKIIPLEKSNKKYIPTEEDIKSLVARNGNKLTREQAIDIISTLFSDDEE